jgi:uncharacterized sodium:solute symporter family permease YidK
VRRTVDAQKNIVVLAFVMVAVVGLFLFLGGLLHLFAAQANVSARGDALFPAVVLGLDSSPMPVAVQVLFVVALISALLPSADGALTALTASFCIDLLRMQERCGWPEPRRVRIRRAVHLGFAVLFLLLVLGFAALNSASMIGLVLKMAAYTYGPLLGLFAFGVLTRRRVADRWVPCVALAAPALCWAVDASQRVLFGRWEIGLELLLLNGALTFAGLWLLSAWQGKPGTRVRGL